MALTTTLAAIATATFAISSVAYLGSGCACLFGNENDDDDDDDVNTNNRKPLVKSESYQSAKESSLSKPPKGNASEATQRPKQTTSRSAPTTRSAPSTRSTESLLDRAVAQNSQQNQQRGPTYKAPVSISKRSASGNQQTLFCACGAPSSANVVKLLPCGCRTLCMPCAQEAELCPNCGTVVEDSEPSFKSKRTV